MKENKVEPSVSKQNNKILNTKKQFDQCLKAFQCPICQKQMKAVVRSSLICKKEHCFDIAKQGYINLIGASNNEMYDKELFVARGLVFKSGVFAPVSERINQIVSTQCKKEKKNIIVDAGCGEGYYLKEMAKNQLFDTQTTLVGIDISKDGILEATRSEARVLWCMANLANMPFRDHSIDVMLNILTPANYGEFKRVLTKAGILVKVIPEAGYLKEIRERAAQGLKNKNYANGEVMDYAEKHMKVLEKQRITYSYEIDHDTFGNLVKMTPMTKGLSVQEVENILGNPSANITVDFSIIVGKNR